ncbi:hypothetical protein [Sinorhizobium medicae]
MAKSLVNPVLFSQHFGVKPSAFAKAKILDPLLNSDTKLFIDPLLLTSSTNEIIKLRGFELLEARFKEIVDLLSACKEEGDPAWKAAAKRLSLQEVAETGLGYGGSSTSGSSRSKETREAVLRTARSIIQLGEDNPQIISLMGMFDEGVGPDTISDTTTSAILPALAEVTEVFCEQNNVPTKIFPNYDGRRLPQNPFKTDPAPIILVPSDVLRELPLAASWSDIDRVMKEVKEVRDAFNAQVGSITQATVIMKKKALKKVALSSLDTFRELFQAMIVSSEPYDPNQDVLGYYAFRAIMASKPEAFQTGISAPVTSSRAELKRVVDAIVTHFKFMVESNNLWELLWDGKKPKREKAAQLLFFWCRRHVLQGK